MGNCLWLLRQADAQLQFQVLGELPYPKNDFAIVRLKVPRPKEAATKVSKTIAPKSRAFKLCYADAYYAQLLHNYFRLDHQLSDYYRNWSAAHPHFGLETADFYVIRQLDQEPVENLFSFICSQNNNIARIGQLVERLCTMYGPKICDYDGRPYHAFPDCVRLAEPSVDADLRAAKFGYRARFIQQSAAQIVERGELSWFARLQRLPYPEAHAELTQLTGIGAKVADCICLMSLGHMGAIPVDTHVYQIAAQHYMPELSATCKSVPTKVYTAIGQRFREVYGPLAGWAQTVLFCADLAKFKKENNNGSSATKERGGKRMKTV